MAKTSKGSAGSKTVKVARDLRIAGAAAAYAALASAAQAPESQIVLDARQVEKVDTAGLQALLAGHRQLVQAGKSVSWSGCPEQLRSAATLLGMAASLGIDS
jgi:anti-anti-sigma regulatory factor